MAYSQAFHCALQVLQLVQTKRKKRRLAAALVESLLFPGFYYLHPPQQADWTGSHPGHSFKDLSLCACFSCVHAALILTIHFRGFREDTPILFSLHLVGREGVWQRFRSKEWTQRQSKQSQKKAQGQKDQRFVSASSEPLLFFAMFDRLLSGLSSEGASGRLPEPQQVSRLPSFDPVPAQGRPGQLAAARE